MFLSTILPLSVIGIGDIVILFVIVRAYIRWRRREKLDREESLPNLLLMFIVFKVGTVTAKLNS